MNELEYHAKITRLYYREKKLSTEKFNELHSRLWKSVDDVSEGKKTKLSHDIEMANLEFEVKDFA